MSSIKLALGIILPLFLVILLVSLSLYGPGLNVAVADSSVDLSLLTGKDTVLLKKYTVENNFFLPRRYEFEPIVACLNDKEGVKKLAGISLVYDNVLYVDDGGNPVYGMLIESSSRSLYGGSSVQVKSVEIPAYGKKEVNLQVNTNSLASYDYNYYNVGDRRQKFSGYDEILLIKPIKKEGSSSYNSYYCRDVSKDEIDNAQHILITNPIPAYTTTTTIYDYYRTTTTVKTCYDSDAGNNYYTRGYINYGTSGVSYDTCLSDTILSEYTCDINNNIKVDSVSCVTFNKKCVNGTCV